MKKLASLPLLGILALGVAPATAGLKTNTAVTITSTKFRGNLSYVRQTGDSVQYLGCQSNKDFTTCAARNAAGTTVQCSTSNAGFLAAVRGLTPFSLLEVTFSNGTCTNLTVSTMSSHAYPLAPESGQVSTP